MSIEIIVDVLTNWDTALVICPLRHQTILEVKGIVEELHPKLFPEHGEIHVVKVRVVLQEGKVTVSNGDIIGNIFQEWGGKIIVKARRKRKTDASHAIGPNGLLPSSSRKETASEYNLSHAVVSDPSMANSEMLVDPIGEYDISHDISPDPNIADQEPQILCEPPHVETRSKPSTKTANCSKAGKTSSLRVSPKSPVRGSTSSKEAPKLSNAGDSSLLPNSSQKSFPTSVSLPGNRMLSSRSSKSASKSPTTCESCGSLIRYLKPSTKPSVESKKFPNSCEASLIPSNLHLQGSTPKSKSLSPKLKRNPATRISVIRPETSSGRADSTKAFWDFWETFKQRRLQMVAYVPNRPMKSPRGPKRRVIGPKTQKCLGVSGRT